MIVELAAIRTAMELIDDNKIDASLAPDFVYLLLKHLHKIENEGANTKGKD